MTVACEIHEPFRELEVMSDYSMDPLFPHLEHETTAALRDERPEFVVNPRVFDLQ